MVVVVVDFSRRFFVGGVFPSVSGPHLGLRENIAGGWADNSRRLQFHSKLRLWYCVGCGCYASALLRELGRMCSSKIVPTRAEYLDGISRGMWPKALSANEKRMRGRPV